MYFVISLCLSFGLSFSMSLWMLFLPSFFLPWFIYVFRPLGISLFRDGFVRLLLVCRFIHSSIHSFVRAFFICLVLRSYSMSFVRYLVRSLFRYFVISSVPAFRPPCMSSLRSLVMYVFVSLYRTFVSYFVISFFMSLVIDLWRSFVRSLFL